MRLDPASGLLAITGVFVPIWLGAAKWRAVISRTRAWQGPDIPPGFYFYHTALATVLGQFLTPYLSGPLIRGYATRKLGPKGFTLGATSSGYEQAFDAYATALFAGIALVLFGAGISAPPALGILALTAIAGWGIVYLVVVNPGLRGKIAALLARTPIPGSGKLADALYAAMQSGVFETGMTARLYLYSVVRFWVLALTAIATARLMGPDFSIENLVFAFAIVQIARFAAFTPGNLGIAEWSWSFVLLAFGWPLETAAIFSITLRIVSLLAIIPVFVSAAVFHIISTQIRPY